MATGTDFLRAEHALRITERFYIVKNLYPIMVDLASKCVLIMIVFM